MLRLTGKEPWLAHSLVEYYYRTRSLRAQDILAQIREPLDKVTSTLHPATCMSSVSCPACGFCPRKLSMRHTALSPLPPACQVCL